MKKGPERSLWEGYAKRLRWPLKLIEVEAKNSFGVEEIKRKEAEKRKAFASARKVDKFPEPQQPRAKRSAPGLDLSSSG